MAVTRNLSDGGRKADRTGKRGSKNGRIRDVLLLSALALLLIFAVWRIFYTDADGGDGAVAAMLGIGGAIGSYDALVGWLAGGYDRAVLGE